MMKSVLRLFAVASLLSAPAMASTCAVGAHAGINISSSSGIPATTTKFMGGVFWDHGFDDMFGLMIELDFKGQNGGNYLALPVLFKVAFNAGSIKPFLVLGPEVALSLTTGVKTIDFGAVAGGGVAFEVAPTVSVHVMGRYDLGFIETASPLTAKNRGIHILGGASFKL